MDLVTVSPYCDLANAEGCHHFDMYLKREPFSAFPHEDKEGKPRNMEQE